MGGRRSGGSSRFLATVFFTDIVGSTDIARELGDRRWRDLLNQHHAIIRRELKRFGGREIDTAGDGFFATFDAPADAIRCACAASDGVQEIGIDIRAGLHVGECEQMGSNVGGIAVHTGARVMSRAGPAEVLVTRTTRDLVAGSGIEFAERGQHALKGLPGEWELFSVRTVDGGGRPHALDSTSAASRRETIEARVEVRRRRTSLLVGAGAFVGLATIAVVLLVTRGGAPITPSPNTLGEIPNGSNGFSQAIQVGQGPSGVAASDGSIFVIDQEDGTVQQIDPDSADTTSSKSTGGVPTGIADGEGAVWITTGFGTAGGGSSELLRYDVNADQITPFAALPSGVGAIAVGNGSVWVADDVHSAVHEVDAVTGDVRTITVGEAPTAIAIGPTGSGPVWVTDPLTNQVSSIDGEGPPRSFDVGGSPSGVAVDAQGDVWVASSDSNSVIRLDETGHTVASISRGIPEGPSAIVASDAGVWVAGLQGRTVALIDPRTNEAQQRVAVGGSPEAMTIDPQGNLWVAVGSG